MGLELILNRRITFEMFNYAYSSLMNNNVMCVPYCAQINFGHIKIFLNGYALVCQKLSKSDK